MSVSDVNTSQSFIIRAVPSEKIPDAVEILQRWERSVDVKLSDAWRYKVEIQSRLHTLHSLVRKVQLGLEDGLFFRDGVWDTVLVCEKDAKVQAFALLDCERSRLTYLLSRPKNVTGKGVKGAGTELVLHLAKECLLAGTDLKLAAADTSVGFYTKLGFVPDVDVSDEAYILTAAKIQQLVANKVPPFDRI